MSWIVYILKCSDESLYTGITNNLEKRLQLHASGKGSKYTRGRGPLKLVHQERFKTRSLASKRELFIKKLNRLDKIKLYND
ncbi:MAG: GIY-YIG nuclease family protein [Pseudomonadota bacterium]|nr:GIY-YIG nuclease family protein [Pseudomonadota bacterium]|tara:strand:+ start:158 stop:400 length:243 start_codon:yes stop_codon:yes gene_type:complete